MNVRNQFFALILAASTGILLNNTARAQQNGAADSTTANQEEGTSGDESSPTAGDSPKTFTTQEAKQAEGIATSTATMETTVKAPKRFGVELYVRGDMDQKQFTESQPALTNRNRVTFKYNLTDTRSIQLRPEFLYYTATPGKAGNMQMGDTFLGYQDSKLIMLPADISVTGIFRYYAPTGQKSREFDNAGSLYTWWIASKSVGKFDFFYHADFNYYLNTKSYHVSEKTENNVTSFVREGNPDYFIDEYFEVAYNFTPKFSPWGDLGSYHETTLGTEGAKYKHADYVYSAVGVAYSATKQISFIGFLMNNAKLDRNNDFAFYRKNENTAVGIMNIAL